MQILFQVRILIILFCCKKYLCRHIHFWDMAEPIKQRVAVHCFENLVQFLNLQKFNTDWKSVAWRKLFLNICLSGIDELGLKRVDLAAVFSLQPRPLNDYRTALSVHEIQFPEPQVKKEPCICWDKRQGGNAHVLG